MDKATGKAAFLGLDGTPHSLVKDLTDKGVMPNLKALMAEGSLMRMETSLPEVSSVAWTTFMTGVNPGRHGVYGFMDLKPGGYQLYFPNYNSVKSRPVWDRFGDAGGRSIVINVPSTYPARPMRGVLTSGFVALDLKKATYPESAYEYLNGMGYRIDVDSVKARESAAFLVEDLKATFAKRREAMLHFLDNEPWELFVGVVTETDRLHHFLWSAYADPSHEYSGFFTEFYKGIDSLIGDFASRLRDDHPGVPFIIMSDHGFTLTKREVFINRWLRENGYLELAASPAKSWDDIAGGTKAFALDPSRVYINLKGKYPRGSVAAGDEYEKVRAELAEALMGLEEGGEKVMKAVYKKEDIYSGPYTDAAPDLVLLSNYGFDLKGSIAKDAVFDNGFLSGMHTQDDAMLYVSAAGAGLEPGVGKRPSILDASATISGWLGLDPSGAEGSPLA